MTVRQRWYRLQRARRLLRRSAAQSHADKVLLWGVAMTYIKPPWAFDPILEGLVGRRV